LLLWLWFCAWLSRLSWLSWLVYWLWLCGFIHWFGLVNWLCLVDRLGLVSLVSLVHHRHWSCLIWLSLVDISAVIHINMNVYVNWLLIVSVLLPWSTIFVSSRREKFTFGSIPSFFGTWIMSWIW
jgi:hypothetical protein